MRKQIGADNLNKMIFFVSMVSIGCWITIIIAMKMDYMIYHGTKGGMVGVARIQRRQMVWNNNTIAFHPLTHNGYN